MSYTAKDLLPLVRGDDWKIKLTILEDGVPVNITGYTYWFTLKVNIDDPDPGALQISVVASGADAANGIVYITVPNFSTNIATQSYRYDVQQIDTSSPVVIRTVLLGKVKVVKDVTRST